MWFMEFRCNFIYDVNWPFDGKNDKEIIENIKKFVFKTNEERWIKGSREIKDLICKLLQ